MNRAEWDALVETIGEPVAFDVRNTPLARLSRVSSIVASVAHKFEPPTARISISPYDEADLPTPINQDEYDVWLDLEKHERVYETVVQATTSLDDNFRQFARESVFLVKRDPGPDHWLRTVPSSTTVLVKKF